MRYPPANVAKAAVAGGHLPFGFLQRMFRCGGSAVQDAQSIAKRQKWGHPTCARYHCFTMIRKPLNRLTGCYYTFFHHLRNVSLEARTPAELRDMFLFARDHYGYGCLNEHLRIFSGSVDEEFLAPAMAGDPLAEALSDHAARNNVAQCVILSLDHWEESRRRIQHYMPWLNAAQLERHLQFVQGELVYAKPHGGGGKTYIPGHVDSFSKEQQATLDSLLDLENRFYRYVVRLFAQQRPLQKAA